jgi:esterase/lipase
VDAGSPIESNRDPLRRERLGRLAMSVWDLRRQQGTVGQTPRGRLIVLRSNARLLHATEAELEIPPARRSFLKIANDGQDACLLIHGMTGCPADMLGLGDVLHEGGMTVYAPLLTGSGDGDLSGSDARWRANLQQARQSFRLLHQSCKRVHVAAASFGAALALHLASLESVTSLALVAPALLPRASFGVRLVLAMKLYRLPIFSRRIPFTADTLDGMRWARDRVSQVQVPIFAVQSEDDHILSPASVRFLQKRSPHGNSRFKVYPSGGHSLLATEGPQGLNQDILEFFREHRGA